MRILLLAGSYPPETGGIARFMKSFVEGLQSRGVEIDVISALNLPEGYWRRVLTCRNAILDHANLKMPDRIVASSWSPYAVGIPHRIGNHAVHVDVFCHGMDLLEPSRSVRYRYLMRRTFTSASRILANSRYTADLALKAGATTAQISILHPVVDADWFSPAPKLSAVPRLLSVGRLVERKGIDSVIRALPLVLKHFPELEFVCVGTGPEEPGLRRLAESVGVTRSIVWAGEITDEELVQHYRAADVFVLPSRVIPATGSVEGFGIVFLEAASCGIPAIGGNSGGTPDAIADGETGYIVDPTDEAELAARIMDLLSNSEMRQRMGAAGRERVLRKFTTQTLADRYLESVSEQSPFDFNKENR